MKYTADLLIAKRKELWSQYHNIERDVKFRDAVAWELLTNANFREEIKANPEKLIELTFIVVDKDKKTTPFFLNDVQKDFIENKLKKAIADYEEGRITNISLLILKGRQQGFTTLISAYQLACTITNKNFEGLTLTDRADNSEAVFQNKAKLFYDHLPEILKPTEKYNSKRQLLFEKLNSSWSVDTATKNVGRSRTINFFHGSECAFWKDGIANIQAGLGEAFTKNAIKIYESTANGFNDFRDMWKSEQHINCFYEWWGTAEYRLNFENKTARTRFLNDIDRKTDWIWTRLKWLRDVKKLDENQLYWYYKKYASYIDKDLIKQEYPCTEDEAFIASGTCYFDTETLIKRIDELENKNPIISQGYFIYDYDGLKISNIRWQEDKHGYIKIYEKPKNNYPYVLGGDTAGEGSDNFTGHVIDNTNGRQVAVLKQKLDEDLYAKQMYCLGIWYNKALIGLEVNFSTFPEKELERLEYPNLYIRDKEDTFVNKKEKKYGFRTTTLTRPIILAMLKEIFRDAIELINDIDTLKEALTFIVNEKGKAEAQEGYHDDLIMAIAITYYIRKQQSMQVHVDEKELEASILKDFGFEEESDDEFGSDIVVI